MRDTALQFGETSKLFLFHKVKSRFEDEREDMGLESSSGEAGLQVNQTPELGLFKGLGFPWLL